MTEKTTPQNITTQGTTQQKPLLVSRKTISRRTSRSKCLYFLANRANANSKIVVDRKKTPQRTSPQQNEGDKQLGDKVGDRKIRV